MLWLAILVPDLALQVFTRGLHEVPPLALVSPRGRVLAATAKAAAAGIEAGQHSASALALLPELRLQPRAPAREAEALAEIATWAGRFTPRISLSAPDAVLLEISSCLRLFGGAARIEAAVREDLAALGFAARLGHAPTPLAARWFARAGGTPGPGRGDGWQAAIDRLPLTLLADDAGCDGATLDLLAGLGLHTLGEVRRLPPAGLARRGAQAALRALARARGEHADPRPWFQPPARFAHGLALPAPEIRTEALLFAARRLFASLAAWLATRHAAIERCTLQLGHDAQPPTEIELVFGRPSRDEARFLLIARERLAALELPAAVDTVRVLADQALAAPAQGGDLFGDPARADEDAALLLARLRNRLGQQGVVRLSTCSDHRPEAAWRTCEPGTDAAATTAAVRRARPFPDAADADATHDTAATAGTHDRPRPLWLLPTPRAIDPGGYTLLGTAERIESGWWDDAPIRRDYYLARDPGHALCWIFEHLDAPGSWFVHGYFG